MAKYNIKGARYLRKYTARTTTPTYAAETDAQTIVDLFCDVPWSLTDVDQATMTSHSEEKAEGDELSGLDRNVLDRDAFDAALFCANHSGGKHRAYANAACYVFELPDSAIGASLTSIAARVTSDPYNSLGARLHVFTGATLEIPMNCHTLRGEDASGEVVSDGSSASGVAPREVRTSGTTSTWHPKTATTTLSPTGGLTLQKYLFLFVGLESYSTVRGNWLEGCSFIRNSVEITLSAACADLDADELNDLSPAPEVEPPESGLMLPVYSYEPSSKPLHIKTYIPPCGPNNITDVPRLSWQFPASYTGKKSLCWLPGATSDMAFEAWVGDDVWMPGDPFGFTPAASASNVQAIALTRVSPVSPRIKLWEAASSDRLTVTGQFSDPIYTPVENNEDPITVNDQQYLVPKATVPTTESTGLQIVRYGVNAQKAHGGVDLGIKLTLNRAERDFIHEGDILSGGDLDLDWSLLSAVSISSTASISTVHYLVLVADSFASVPWLVNNVNYVQRITAHPLTIYRPFETTRTAPTAVSCEAGASGATFRWRISGEALNAKVYGSSYTAFKIAVFSAANGGGTALHSTGFIRMPPQEFDGSYVWEAPASWLSDVASWASWRIYTYNSRFKDDNVSGVANIS